MRSISVSVNTAPVGLLGVFIRRTRERGDCLFQIGVRMKPMVGIDPDRYHQPPAAATTPS